MSTPRVTQRLMVERSMYALQTGMSRLATSQERLSTGRQINRPSDDPTGTNSAMRLRATITDGAQYTRNAEDGLSWLGKADSTLTSMLDSVRAARDLVVQGASSGSAGKDQREAIAQQLDQLRTALVDDANTTYLGRPIFGGTTAGTKAYAADGTFLGDTNAVTRTISDGTDVAVNVTGPSAFTTNGGTDDLFTVISDAATLARTDPDALGGALDRLDAVAAQMRTQLTSVGARYDHVETTTSQLSSAALANQTALSNVENVDVAQAIMDVQMQEVAYQASLGATARVLQPSLLDFLR
jgi:flagellar hook-associated protein 3 FlgL